MADGGHNDGFVGLQGENAKIAMLRPEIDELGNDERLEWILAYAQPHQPATQKRMIVQAGMGSDPILSPQQVNLALSALGLGAS